MKWFYLAISLKSMSSNLCIYLNKIILVLHMYDVLQFFVL